jgi:hypothetical protein
MAQMKSSFLQSSAVQASPLQNRQRFASWRGDYKAVLAETETAALFRRVEVAEAAIRMRIAAETEFQPHAERVELAAALAYLGVIKRERLKFTGSAF